MILRMHNTCTISGLGAVSPKGVTDTIGLLYFNIDPGKKGSMISNRFLALF